VQFSYYLLISLTILLLDGLFQIPISFGTRQLFDVALFNFHEPVNSISAATVLVCSPFSAYLLSLIVGRPKKVLDFSITRFVIHLIICTVYSSSFPSSIEWWACGIAGVVVETLLGEYMSVRRELQKTFGSLASVVTV